MTGRDRPAPLAAHPLLAQWLRMREDGRIELRSGKVELGQGIATALAQIVVAELDLPPERISVAPAATDSVPDEGYTAGSASIETSGAALRLAAATLRRHLLAAAHRRSGVPLAALRIVQGAVVRGDDHGHVATIAELAGDVPPDALVEEPHGEPAAARVQLSRLDLPGKVLGGAAFVHDLRLPGMLHGRVLLPPTPGSRLKQLPIRILAGLPSLVATFRDGSIAGLVTEREIDAVRGLGRLEAAASWREEGKDASADAYAHLQGAGLERVSVVGRPLDLPAGARTFEARFRKPAQAHAAIAPSCAIALWNEQGLTVWTHGQGIFPLRRELAGVLELAEERIVVRHVEGPGCYGHNGADDVAGHAALLAREVPGRPVRLQWTSEQEFRWEPYGPAMQMDLRAALGHDGRIVAWRHHVRSDAHALRPNGSGDRLMIAWHRNDPEALAWPGAQEGGYRNATPIYALPNVCVEASFARGPLRTSALRTLGAFANTFAIESFVDELAHAAGQDPVAFRLGHLDDPRAIEVLRAAVTAAAWHPTATPSGRGLGIALARYKNTRAYVAQVAEVEVDPNDGRIRVSRVVVACDAGRVVHTDGLRNQLEGGTLQGVSRTLFEEARQGAFGAAEARGWAEYPVLRFRDVPRIDTVLIDRPDSASLGAGEAATTPIAAAIANAVFDASGIRLRELPFSPARVQRRLLSMADDEASHVILGPR